MKRAKAIISNQIPTFVTSLDDWQEKVLETKGNMCLRSGRQVGKSFIIGKKAAKYAMENKNKLIMVIAFTEKQALLLFSKILHNIIQTDKTQIAKPKPTKHIIHLKNGSQIHCYAAGDTGFGIMGFTIDLLIADEAAWIKEEVWNSIIPALAITRGAIWLLSTPFLSEGYYYDCFRNKTFTSFHQSAEDCPRKDEVFLEERRKTLTKAKYAQMYLGEFVDDFHRIFSEDWIDKVCVNDEINYNPCDPDNQAIGIDVAGMGEDESTFEGIHRKNDKWLQFHHETTEKTRITDTFNKIKDLNVIYDSKYIGIDGGGLGVGLVDMSLAYDPLKRIVKDLNNAKRVVDVEEREKGQLLKEAMYSNMLAMGETGDLKLFNNDEIRASLRSIHAEKKEGGGEKISGNYSHIVEGLIRACWLLKQKELNMKVYSIPV